MTHGAGRVGIATTTACALLVGVPLAAQSAQRPDTAFTRAVIEYTTDPHFLPASVDSLPLDPKVPSPQQYFGTIIGAPGVMHHTTEIYGYFAALAKATPRVALDTLGRSEEGRAIILVIVGDSATVARRNAYRELTARLADPRTLPASELDRVLDRAKPIYYVNAGLHSAEMGSPEMVMELAYRLAVDDRPAIARIRDNVLVLINPVSEPDGRDKQVDWYDRYTKSRKVWDDGFPRSSPYWGKYIFHDNNRDGIQMTQAVTKTTDAAFYTWHPTVMHDLHESIPLLYVSTGTGPYNEYTDPITIGEWQTMANNDIRAVAAQGLPGAWTWAFFDGWWPGYLVWVANNHNAIGRFFETFGNAGANTYVRDLSTARFAGDSVTARTWYRPWPPTRKVRWSARDNTNYMEAGLLASLEYASQNGRQLLHDFWQKGENAIESGRSAPPYAFVIPALTRQRDPRRAAYLINQLKRQHIEVHWRMKGDSSGDFVVLLDQPYRNLAITLLTDQKFPVNDPNAPYDDVAWTLGPLYGVTVHEVNDSSVYHWPGLQIVHDSVAYIGTVSGTGSTYILNYRAQAEVLPALYWLRGVDSQATAVAAESSFTVARHTYPIGSVIFRGLSHDEATQLGLRYGLDLRAAPAPNVPTHALDLPRIAVYHTWFSTQDNGWTRYMFDRADIPYTPIDKDDLRRGHLHDRFDVILVPNANGSVATWIHGVDSAFSPLAFDSTAQTPALGHPYSSPDITGGPGFTGLAELQRFVQSGGVVVTLGAATRLVAETGIARALEPLAARGLFHPGSVVRVKARRPDSPILYGYPDTTHVFRGNMPLYQVPERDRAAMMVLQYGTSPLPDEKADEHPGPMLGMPGPATPAKDTTHANGKTEPYVISGGVRNAKEIIGQGAIFNVPVGAGRVIAFTFDPLHRYLNLHDSPLVYNVLLNWDDLK